MQVGLVNSLMRHYTWIAVAQARKVLGGAGPAIAIIPASILWASISMFDLGRDIAQKRVAATAVLPRMAYVFLTATGQVRVATGGGPPHPAVCA
jgi:hypothetical protein